MSLLAHTEAELLREYDRKLLAECWLGTKGEHFDGDEWEQRADAIAARVWLSEAQFDMRMGWL